MEKKQLQETAFNILNKIGINTAAINHDSIVNNCGETEKVNIHGTKVNACVTCYEKGGFRIEVNFELPEGACLAETYIEHCVGKGGIQTNEYGRPYAGRKTRKPLEKYTEAYSPWNNHYFCIDSMYYGDDEFDEAVKNTIILAKPFVEHLADVPSIRYWNRDDREVMEKAKEIVRNADLKETDCDREDKSHWLVDKNSFIKGWFFPFNDRGSGTFDTILYGVEFAAKTMGREGTFEFAVACRVLIDPEYITKARRACRIRKEKIEEYY